MYFTNADYGAKITRVGRSGRRNNFLCKFISPTVPPICAITVQPQIRRLIAVQKDPILITMQSANLWQKFGSATAAAQSNSFAICASAAMACRPA
jgi:hypothetical protein